MNVLPRTIAVPRELVGRRVILRPYEPEDGPAVHEAIDETRAILETMWPEVQKDVAQTIDWCARAKARWIDRDDMPYAMFERATGRFLGGSGLVRNDWRARKFEVGYWVRHSAWGKGFVVESVALQTRCAFEELGANRVEIRCDAGNTNSARVAERAGFPLEATLRRERARKDGTVCDTLVFAALREDFDRLLSTWSRHFEPRGS
ncbi:MAG TPA: GNAT family N-acetyltransferase [Labilithrix sp.]